jgi:hypothetical protein
MRGEEWLRERGRSRRDDELTHRVEEVGRSVIGGVRGYSATCACSFTSTILHAILSRRQIHVRLDCAERTAQTTMLKSQRLEFGGLPDLPPHEDEPLVLAVLRTPYWCSSPRFLVVPG